VYVEIPIKLAVEINPEKLKVINFFDCYTIGFNRIGVLDWFSGSIKLHKFNFAGVHAQTAGATPVFQYLNSFLDSQGKLVVLIESVGTNDSNIIGIASDIESFIRKGSQRTIHHCVPYDGGRAASLSQSHLGNVNVVV
jgi:hypothetical protein